MKSIINKHSRVIEEIKKNKTSVQMLEVLQNIMAFAFELKADFLKINQPKGWVKESEFNKGHKSSGILFYVHGYTDKVINVHIRNREDGLVKLLELKRDKMLSSEENWLSIILFFDKIYWAIYNDDDLFSKFNLFPQWGSR